MRKSNKRVARQRDFVKFRPTDNMGQLLLFLGDSKPKPVVKALRIASQGKVNGTSRIWYLKKRGELDKTWRVEKDGDKIRLVPTTKGKKVIQLLKDAAKVA